MRGNQRIDDLVNVAACEVMRLELVDLHVETGLVRLDERQNDLRGRHAAHAHADERDDADAHVGGQRRNPKPERHEMQEQHDSRDDDDEEEARTNE